MEEDCQDLPIEEALRWRVVLHDADATEAERREFAVWLECSAAHRVAWERAQHVWSRIDIVEPAIRAGRGAAVPGSGPALTVRTRNAHGISRRQWIAAAAAAGVVAVVGSYAVTHPELMADYRTGIGERRTITLVDGSVVELGSGSALSVAFDEDIRSLSLHEGEAFFTVVRDHARPFVVTAANGRIESLGTTFNVKRTADSTTVSVVEHAVAVAARGARPVRIDQGRQLRYGPAGVGEVRKADLSAVLAWRQDRLVFQDEPLGEVIADLERYRTGQIVITDRRLAVLPVTAVFDVHQTDAALRTIADTLPVHVRKVTDLLVLISPGCPPAA